MANESENPLDDLSPDEQQALKQLAEKRASKSVGRRDALKAGGALSIGALIGGGSAATAIDSAAADASTSDSTGDVGEPGDRVDLFTDGVDFTDYEININGNGNLTVIHEPSSTTWTYKSDGTLSSPKLSSDELSITNETLVVAYLSGSQQSISADTPTKVRLDAESKDERAEFDTGAYTFTPDESGYYLINAKAAFLVGADQDTLFLDLVDGGGSILNRVETSAASGSSEALQIVFLVELTAGTAYHLEVTNKNSSDSLNNGQSSTFLRVRRVFR